MDHFIFFCLWFWRVWLIPFRSDLTISNNSCDFTFGLLDSLACISRTFGMLIGEPPLVIITITSMICENCRVTRLTALKLATFLYDLSRLSCLLSGCFGLFYPYL